MSAVTRKPSEDVRSTGGGVARLDAARLRAVCADAWDGLRHLNRVFLHADIKPANVLVELLPDGSGVRGVVADIDDMVARTAAERAAQDAGPIVIMSTPFYGSPFPHGDVRRDQAAMLLTTLHTLGPVAWTDHCSAALARGTSTHQLELLRSHWGYAVGEEEGDRRRPDRWRYYRRGVYAGYADAIEIRGGGASPLVGLLRALDASTEDHRDARWSYESAHQTVVQWLRAPPPQEAAAQTPHPDGHRRKRAHSSDSDDENNNGDTT